MNNTTYLFLNSIRFIDAKINRLAAKRYQLETCLLPTGIRYDKDKVQTSPEDTVSKICSDIAECDKEIDLLVEKKRKQILIVDGTLAKLPSDTEQTVLILRYIQRVPVKQMAKEMGYTTSNIHKIRKRGIDHLTDILEGGKSEVSEMRK